MNSKLRSVTIDTIWEYLLNIDADSVLANCDFEQVKDGEYGRFKIQESPFEVTVLFWPPRTQSAIHKHDGFHGAVKVISGTVLNREYHFEESTLSETAVSEYRAGGIVEEPDGVIHLLENPLDVPSISIHAYFPAISSFEGMQLYHVDKRSIGTLSASATSASWKNEPGHFESVQTEAFSYLPLSTSVDGSHYFHPIIPKPDQSLIVDGLLDYYNNQAEQYDNNDRSIKWRNEYTQGLNTIIASELKKKNAASMLAMCCGTGRRPANIKELSGLNLDLYGLDVSEKMCEEARNKGLQVHCSDILDLDIEKMGTFDAITYLYAFGHLSSRNDRISVLSSVKKMLNEGGTFYADLFCLNNIHERGGAIQALHSSLRLPSQGYESGDIFYRRKNGAATAYLHYFTRDEVYDLFESAGFTNVQIQKVGYTIDSGKLHSSPNEGMYFVKAS